MPEKDTPLAVALGEVMRLHEMISRLPRPTPDTRWTADYIQWWFQHMHKRRNAEPPVPLPIRRSNLL